MFSGSAINMKRAHTDDVLLIYTKWINTVIFFYIIQLWYCVRERKSARARERKRESEFVCERVCYTLYMYLYLYT